MISIDNDITDTISAQKDLSETEARLQLLM